MSGAGSSGLIVPHSGDTMTFLYLALLPPEESYTPFCTWKQRVCLPDREEDGQMCVWRFLLPLGAQPGLAGEVRLFMGEARGGREPELLPKSVCEPGRKTKSALDSNLIFRANADGCGRCLEGGMYPDSETSPRSIEKECLDQLKGSAQGTGQRMGALVPLLLVNVPSLCTKPAILARTTLREPLGEQLFLGARSVSLGLVCSLDKGYSPCPEGLTKR